MSKYPEAKEFGYNGKTSWNQSDDWHSWKIACAEWLIEYEKEEIAKHEQAMHNTGEWSLF